MENISKVENIQVKNEDLQSEFTSMISEMQETTDFKKLEKQLKNERVANALAMQAASRIMNRQVLDCLKNIATGKAEAAPEAADVEKKEAKPKASKKKAEKTSEWK